MTKLNIFIKMLFISNCLTSYCQDTIRIHGKIDNVIVLKFKDNHKVYNINNFKNTSVEKYGFYIDDNSCREDIDGVGIKNSFFTFIREKDTMVIKTKYSCQKNICLENIDFKKGKYLVVIKDYPEVKDAKEIMNSNFILFSAYKKENRIANSSQFTFLCYDENWDFQLENLNGKL